MKILVTGAGRGGTNLAIELIRSTDFFDVTDKVEDRDFFSDKKLKDKYATKLATEYVDFNENNIIKVMTSNEDLNIIFVVRNPIDHCLSKIMRGQTKSNGGDSYVDEIAPDGTLDGSIDSLKHMFKIFKFFQNNYSDRFIWLRMEDLISNPKEVAIMISDKLGFQFTDKMLDFYSKNRNPFQKKRYGNNLVKRIDVYKDLENNYNGFFVGKSDYIDIIKKELMFIINEFDYNVE